MKDLEREGKKFFLYLHYSNIHTNIKHNVLTKYTNHSQEYFEKKSDNAKKYDEYFKNAETYLKNVIDKCKTLDLLNNTILVIFSDHGISIGDKFGERAYGVYCYDYTVKNFVLFIQKDIFPVKTITQQVRSIDILPTLLEVLKIDEDDSYNKISGKSVLPLINGNSLKDRPAIIESGNPLGSNKPPKKPNIIAIRKNNRKLIINLYNNTIEFYDLNEDPQEKNNLHVSDVENIEEKELLDLLLEQRGNLDFVKESAD